MRTHTLLLFITITWFQIPLQADQAALDKLVAQEQGDVDNESVNVYGGTIGKLEAIFHIEWAGDAIFGWYYYPSRGRDRRYTIHGHNPEQGVITFQEFTHSTDGEVAHTANCRLTKTISSTRITWKGQMNNNDGRVLPMQFSRLR
ncbi:MAG: hypothetical protein ACPGFB_15740 [Verrucomicrobiales bacterium]